MITLEISNSSHCKEEVRDTRGIEVVITLGCLEELMSKVAKSLYNLRNDHCSALCKVV
ncbi:MAG TPA: hypothetical protein GX721_09945 [Firmicutes bacterium]|nr:hypothetical protein [Bacillota bacterium]